MSITLKHALYFGAEQLASGATSYGKAYWNVALGLDEAALPTTSACTLSWRATASSTRFDVGAAPAGTTWPQLTWAVPLTTAGSGALTCTRHPLFGAASDVGVAYDQDAVWPYELYGDVLAGGAGAFARESGANAAAPAWASAPDLGVLAYAANLNVTLSAPDADPGATVTYSSPDLPAWLDLDPDTGALTGGTLDEGELGVTTFTVVASDGLHDTPRLFTLRARFAAHCEAIRQAQPTLSGLSLHAIDPAGAGADVFDALCDMTSYGGGWTLVTAQLEADPIPWAEGRQADYDPTLAAGASFALAPADLVDHDQLAWGRLEPAGAGSWDQHLIDYAALTYDPAADYAEVPLQGLATARTFRIDRHTALHHSYHNPQAGTGSVAIWNGTLTIDQDGGRLLTWSFSPNHDSLAAHRGFGYDGIFWTTDDTFAWALWVRPGGAHTPSPTAPPASCLALKQANPGLTGVSLQTIQPAGSTPIQVLCEMSQWDGGWTLVAAQHETTPVVDWAAGLQVSSYTPSLTPNDHRSFVLAGVQLPARTQTAFGVVFAPEPGAWTTLWTDYVNLVYNTGNYHPPLSVAGLATANSYQVHRNGSSYYSGHNPEEGSGSSVDWNGTLTFDQTGGRGFTWAYSPRHITPGARGYAFAGTQYFPTDNPTWFWAVWVR